MRHEFQRIRHELRFRDLEIVSRTYVTPHMLRLTLAGPDLSDFHSLSPDDHIKVIVPSEAGEVRRDYTPRRFDPVSNRLEIDFALHEAGPVTRWATEAQVGGRARIAGPRGSVVIPDDFDWWLLIGDESALAAIGRRLEAFPDACPVKAIATVRDASEVQTFAAKAALDIDWVFRPMDRAADPEPVLDVLRRWRPPAGEGLIWIAGEAGVVRALRAYVLDDLKHNPRWVKASGYWVQGQADAHEKFEA